MRTARKPANDVSTIESVCGTGLMLIAFAVSAYVMFGVANLAVEAVSVPFLALP